jgi:hypothetical protein
MVKTESMEVKLMTLTIIQDRRGMVTIFLILHLKNSHLNKMMKIHTVIGEKVLSLLILVMGFMMKEAIIIKQTNHNMSIVKEEVLANGRIKSEFLSQEIYVEVEMRKIHQKVKIIHQGLLSKVKMKVCSPVIIFIIMMIYLWLISIILKLMMDKEEVEDLVYQELGLGMVDKVVILTEKQMIKVL